MRSGVFIRGRLLDHLNHRCPNSSTKDRVHACFCFVITTLSRSHNQKQHTPVSLHLHNHQPAKQHERKVTAAGGSAQYLPAIHLVCYSGVPPSSKHQLPGLQRDRVHLQWEGGGLQQDHPLQERVGSCFSRPSLAILGFFIDLLILSIPLKTISVLFSSGAVILIK